MSDTGLQQKGAAASRSGEEFAFVITHHTPHLLGKGIYTVPDASRLSRVSSRRIRYWLKGISSETAPESDAHQLWKGELRPIEDKLALGFHDLQEVRFIDAFRKAGVSWHLLRAAHDVARQRYAIEHPFCTRRFVTDGSQIIEGLGEAPEGPSYEEVVQGQRMFPRVIKPFLRELEFADGDHLVRWWPLGKERSVVLDPQRQFGQPITARAGIATEILRAAESAGQSVEEIAEWYELDALSVRDALEFEHGLAA
jgi:uncharacterized protein (DUF433 family)/DNA-binding transcriptional MerR regulator